MNEEQRKAVYGLVAAIMAVATVFGLLDADTAGAVVDALTSLIGALAAVLAYTHTGHGKHRAD